MESDLGKLFIGGISWDTDEDRLKEYFGNYGQVVEAVIMRDRATGRARGFGFIVFVDPSVAERVIMDKHIIDGRSVEAKKAVPKDDQHVPNNNRIAIGSIHGSPAGPGRTRKIFVGGLASTVTESDFKSYFDQFGSITDVVVMYDHNTQRPRGFGFITFDSEDSVERVLHRTFHELNGKMVEVKRAVPKELSPGPGRNSPLVMGHGYVPSRAAASALLGYNFGPIPGLGPRLEERFARGGFSPFGASGYGMGVNLDQQGLSPTYSTANPIGTSLGYARILSPYYNANGSNNNSTNNSNRYNTPIGYNVGNGRNGSALSSAARNVWGPAGGGGSHNAPSPGSPGGYLSSGSGIFGVWGPSNVVSAQGGSGYSGSNSYGSGDNSGFGFGEGGGYGRSGGAHGSASAVGYERSYSGDVYRGGSVYGGDSAWRSTNHELDGSGSFGYGLGNVASDVGAKSSEDYIGSYGVTNRQPNRGIAA